MDIICHAREKPNFDMWVYFLKRLLRQKRDGAVWLLDGLISKSGVLKTLLLNCSVDENRNAFADILSSVIAKLAPDERELYWQMENQESKSVVARFIQFLLSLPMVISFFFLHDHSIE